MVLAAATPAQVEEIYTESHSLWGAGLGLRDYVGLWADLRETAWARHSFEHRAWLDGEGTILSSFKLYRPWIRIGDETVRAAGIGAVYTPAAHRRRGHAAAMLRAELEQARARGDALSILFSDIGTRYYAALGFTELPADESWGVLGRGSHAGPPGWSLRPMRPADIPRAAEARDAGLAGERLAFVRDRDAWDYVLERARNFYARYDGSDLSTRYRVALRGGAFAGYLVSVEAGAQWIVREVGAAGGDRAACAAICRAGAADAVARGMREVYGWFPPGLAERLPEWGLRSAARTHAVPMVRALREGIDPGALAAARPTISFLDQF